MNLKVAKSAPFSSLAAFLQDFHVIAKDTPSTNESGCVLSQLRPKDKGYAEKYRVRMKQVTRQRKNTPHPNAETLSGVSQ